MSRARVDLATDTAGGRDGAPRPKSNGDGAALHVARLHKSFGGTVALRDAHLTVRDRTVHGLLGENGSGKSTFIKLLAGYHLPDVPTELRLLDSTVSLPLSAAGYRSLGIAFVHQDLALVPTLSVLENLRVDSTTASRTWRVHWREERRRARELLDEHGIPVRIDQEVGELARHLQTMIAIARAIDQLKRRQADHATARGVMVLDEPTAALTGDERAHLHEIISRFRADGGAVILVSHDIDEALALTDEITVLRNGLVAARFVTSETTGRELVDAIVGEVPLRAVRPPEPQQLGDTRCVVTGLRSPRLDGVDLSLRAGEIVGVTGLAGSGFTDVSSLLTGVDAASAGVLSLDGHAHELRAMNPRLALRKGIGFVPGSRSLGCVGDLSVTDNITLAAIASRGTRFTLPRRELRARARSMIEEYRVKTPRADLPLATLSGGNQQKVLLARCLSANPKLLLLDEPTAGVDVGARVEIFRILRQAASEGTAILCASSDWEQLELICNRVVVIREGRVVAELPAPITKSAIADACFVSRGQTDKLRGD